MDARTFRDAVRALLQTRPGEWIPWWEFAEVGGRCAWRTRISDCRQDYGMEIENRVRRLEDGQKLSEYRWRPRAVPVQESFL